MTVELWVGRGWGRVAKEKEFYGCRNNYNTKESNMDEYDIDNNEFYDLNRSLRNQVDGLLRDYSKLKNIIKNSENASRKLAENIRPLENKLHGLQAFTRKLLSNISGSLFGSLGSNKTDLLHGVLAKILVGGRATGGNVVPGQPYVVGERGPEIFTPLTSGNIIANNSIGKNNRPINITMNINTPDITSFQKSETQLVAQLSRAVRRQR